MPALKIFSRIFDLVETRSTTGGHFYTNFDGLRALAALMVINMHFSYSGTIAAGAPGVFLFFGLSGFLLYTGFLAISELNARSMVAYMVRRVFRILPLFAVFVLVFVYGYSNWSPDLKLSWSIGHLLFLQGKIHLWTIRAEMAFYVSLPFVMVALAFIRSAIIRFVLLLLIAAVLMYLRRIEDYYAMFFIGMAAVHARLWIRPGLAKFLTYGSLLLILYLSTFTEFTEPFRHLFGIDYRPYMYRYGLVLFPLCFLAIAGISRFESRIFSNRWMRLMGVCGYGIYLWHILIMYIVKEWQLGPWLSQALMYGLTITLSIATYVLVEKPGINAGRWIARWVNSGGRVLRLPAAWICLVVLSMVLGLRLTYSDPRIRVQTEIWASKSSFAVVYLDGTQPLLRHQQKIFRLIAGRWVTASFTFWDQDVDKLQIEFNEPSVDYKLRNFKIRFAYDDKKSLASADFAAGRNTSISTEDGVLQIQSADRKTVASLRYTGGVVQPWLTATRLGVLMVPVYLLALILVFLLLDGLLHLSYRLSGHRSPVKLDPAAL